MGFITPSSKHGLSVTWQRAAEPALAVDRFVLELGVHSLKPVPPKGLGLVPSAGG